jgi:ferric-dicitrate binding protein FerR (iron transport regulator)
VEDRLITWVLKEKQKSLSPEERIELDVWRSQGPANERMYQDFHVLMESNPQWPVPPDTDKAWATFVSHLPPQLAVHRQHMRIRYWLPRVAAVLLVALSIGYLVWPSSDRTDWSTDATPLTLSLKDGTDILLASGSSLQIDFPEAWRTERRVRLEGVAFFEVAKDKDRAFLIEAGDVLIRVFGTAFNVAARPEEDFIEIIVTRGSIGVHVEGGSEPIVLGAGDVLRWDKSGGIKHQYRSTTSNHLAWHDGILTFAATPLSEVCLDLSRHFQVQIQVVATMASCPLTARFEDASLDEILETLMHTHELSVVSQPGGGVLLAGSSCD